jgi:glycosyltransferase involved in cell wall biosynthesis
LYESLAAGLPIIQTTQGWIKDLLEEHQCGFTINAKQPDALAELLIKLYEDPQLCEAMGVRGRELAEKEFDSDKLANNMLNLITRVI